MSFCFRVLSVLMLMCAFTPATRANVIVDWNETALAALLQRAKLRPGSRRAPLP